MFLSCKHLKTFVVSLLCHVGRCFDSVSCCCVAPVLSLQPHLLTPPILKDGMSFLCGVFLGRVSVDSPLSDNRSDRMLTSVGRESIGGGPSNSKRLGHIEAAQVQLWPGTPLFLQKHPRGCGNPTKFFGSGQHPC